MGTSGKEGKEEKIPPVPEKWDRCHAYMEKKRRFCRQRRHGKSLLYCGNHQHLETSSKTQRKRIPCPIDPSHLIFEDQVDKHILVCPRVKKRKRQERAFFFRENINLGGSGDLCDSSSTCTLIPDNVAWAKNLALRVLEVHQQVFEREKQDSVVSFSELTFSDLHGVIETRDFSQNELDAGMLESFQSHRIKSGGSRHIPQIASLVGHLRAIGVLPRSSEMSDESSESAFKKPLVLLEMGAGRGMLGLAVAGAAGTNKIDTHLMMIERAGTRSKAEKIFRNLNHEQGKSSSYLTLDKIKWSRINCDLSHVYLPVLLEKEEFQNAKIVVIAKHLCGVGTDLALKAIEPIRDRVSACVMATCCHGVCNWCGYVGRDFLRKKIEDPNKNVSFGPKEFDLMRKWCAGTVACDLIASTDELKNTRSSPNTNMSEQEEEPQVDHAAPDGKDTDPPSARVNISAIVSSLNLACGVKGLGRVCQRLIDYGRREYLRNNLFRESDTEIFDSEENFGLYHYVAPETTPQNAVLVAYRK
jgi:tRNA:m4X modification enzyme